MSSSPAEFSITPPGRDPLREASRDRRPPYSEDAEVSVLSAMLLDAEAVTRAVELVDESMFYREGHRRIFRAALTLHQNGAVVDPVTLAEELERQGALQAAGGREYIGVLLYAVPTAANVEYHAKIVREKALRRRLIDVAQSLVQEAHESPSDANELIDLAEHKIFQVSQQRGGEGFTRIKELLWPAMERIEQLREGGPLTGVPSGFVDLDKLTLGFQPSDLIIVAARPSMGKTAFVLNVAQYAAVEGNVPTAIFSLEMSKESLVQRMLASEGYIDAQRLRSGKLTSQDHSNLAKAAALLGQAPIWIDDTPGITLLELRSRARRLKAQANIQMVVVDYLQLLSGPPGVESRQQEISQISRSLKILAKELSVPVLALSQLSRAPEQRTGENKRPQLSDLRESGAIEQDADLVMFIYRPEMYERPVDEQGNVAKMPDGTPVEGYAEVIVGKQRNGPTGFVKLNFRKQFTRFENFTARQPT
jgi:replicative DNA helicase